jgi:hypothetical protein
VCLCEVSQSQGFANSTGGRLWLTPTSFIIWSQAYGVEAFQAFREGVCLRQQVHALQQHKCTHVWVTSDSLTWWADCNDIENAESSHWYIVTQRCVI